MSYFLREDSVSKGDSCKLKEIPHLNSPEKISQLNFSHNQIRVIPQHITFAGNLQIVDLSHNKISKIENIFEVTSLKFINLGHNMVSQVPEKIVQLVELQNLDLGFNRIVIMNNIRVLKNFVQMRTFEYRGFIQVNLEGNEVLKKKGCREIYKKWMNPSIEDYNKMTKRSCYQNLISKTERRMSKSVQNQVKNKENTLMETKKSLVFTQNSIAVSSFNPCKENPLNKSKDNMENSKQLYDHLRLSPNFISYEEVKDSNDLINELAVGLPAKSQMLKSANNIKDLSSIHENNPTSEWFIACGSKLKELSNIFTLIITNEDIKGLETGVRDKIVEQSLYAKEIVNVSLETIELTLNQNFTAEDEGKYTEDISMMFDKVKEIHKETMVIFNRKEYLPIKLYKPWVLYFRQLKNLVQSISPKIHLFQIKCQRDRQLQDLMNISPEKPEFELLSRLEILNKESAVNSKQNIDELLFSKDKEDFLLLSDYKRSNSQKKLVSKESEAECENCLVMKWQSSKTKEDLKEINKKVERMEAERIQHLEQLKYLEEIKIKYLSLTTKQELIIQELETIQPSTYQNILLEQAKTIQYMIGLEPMAFQSKSLPSGKKTVKHSASVGPEKEKEVLNTRLSSGKQKKESVRNSKKISEFTVEGHQSGSSVARGSSYFKNKNVITTINRTGEECKTMSNRQDILTEDNRLERGEIVVSQFNSEPNSLENNSNQNKQKLYGQAKDRRQLKKISSISSSKQSSKMKSKTIQKEKTENEVILISEQSAAKIIPQNQDPIFSIKGKRREHNLMENYLQSEEFQKLIEHKLQTEKERKGVTQFESFNKFGGKIDLKRGKTSKKRQFKANIQEQYENKENMFPQRVKRTKTAQLLDQLYVNRYKDHGYLTMQSKEADNYKKYMQYHLRNNIIDILCKKGAHPDNKQFKIQKKYLKTAKSQRLIHKRSESELLKTNTERSKEKEINQTFR